MAKKRVHDYEIYSKEWYGALSIWARELLDGLIDFADDEGFESASPKILRSRIFPFDDISLEDVEKYLQEIKNSQPSDPIIRLLEREINARVERYYWLRKFLHFQPRPDYPVPSKIANLLIDIGKLDRSFNGGVHQKFCRQWAKRKHLRSEKVGRGEERTGLERTGLENNNNIPEDFSQRANLLKDKILQNNPKAKIKENYQRKWGDVVRLMVERDKRTLKEIDEIINFSQEDKFWKGVILSMGNLREKFDKLTMQKKRDKPKEATWRDK